MSLSCLWLPGAKQGAFPSVQLRDLRPSLHLCSMHGLTTQVFLPLFLSQGRPGQTVAPLGLWPQGLYLPLQIQAEWSQHPPGLCPGLRPGGSHVSKWTQTECSPAAASKASSVQWCVLPGLPCAPGLDFSPAFPCGSGLPREKEPCAGQGRCLTLLDPARLAHGLGLAQHSGNSQ